MSENCSPVDPREYGFQKRLFGDDTVYCREIGTTGEIHVEIRADHWLCYYSSDGSQRTWNVKERIPLSNLKGFLEQCEKALRKRAKEIRIGV